MLSSSLTTLALSLCLFGQATLASPLSTIAPAPTPTSTVNATYAEGTITSAGGAAYGGALNPLPTQHHTDGADGIPAPPPGLTITVLNKHSVAVSTTHARNPEAPAATSGYFDPGTIDVGQGAIFAVPTNWAGRVAVAEAKNGPLTDGRDVSLIEANFLYSDAYGVAVADVDISFVDAFSVPITCSCSGHTVTGCNKNLFALNACPAGDLHGGSCYNPNKPNNDATAATPFFAPCARAAYTFPKDNQANSWGDCQSGHIECCIGTACAPGPKQ